MKKKTQSWTSLIIAAIHFQSAMLAAAATVTTTPASSSASSASTTVSCYTCGQSEIDPELDQKGSYCDLDKDDNCPDGKKMYNNTCDIMDRLGASDFWVRECPEGVKSCFYAQGTYLDQTPIFRGCAGALYPYDERCTRSLQAVTVVAGQQSVDVQVFLCYCNENNCNQVLSGAHKATNVATAAVVLLHIMLARVLAW